MKKKILIVGGTGFLGFHFCNYFIKKKYQVFSISRSKPKKNKKIFKVKYIHVDIVKKKLLKKKINKFLNSFTHVINASGNVNHNNFKTVYESHFLGLKNLADLFLKTNIKKFIQLGSSMEYGKLISPQSENKKNNPISYYGKSKYKATKYLIKLHKKKKFPVVILKLYQIYGPHQEDNRFIPYVIKNSIKNNKFSVSKGNQKRDFLFVNDLLDVVNKILFKTKHLDGEVFNIGYGKAIAIKRIINIIINNIKKGKPEFGKILLRKEENILTYPNIKKIKRFVDWKPKISLVKGINKTIKFYKKNK